MSRTPQNPEPIDAAARRAIKPVTCYPVNQMPTYDDGFYERVRAGMTQEKSLIIPPRDARTFDVPAGHLFRIVSIEGPQVGDLNLWNKDNLKEEFYTGKTRALHSTHVTTSHRLWSNMPYVRPMATVTHDTLDWYGFDKYGGGVHDIQGTRCDPYTNRLLDGSDYHYCCHSNLTRALSTKTGMPPKEAELYVHDVLNVFMCTGFTQDTHQFFMKSSPVRPGDYIEFFAEINLLAAVSTCPGGDCGAKHSSDLAQCHPLKIEIYKPTDGTLDGWESPLPNAYSRTHGLD